MFHIKKCLDKGRQNITTLIKRRQVKKRKDKYKQLPSEDKKKLQEYSKQWFNKQTPEKQLELKQKARKYHKNRYDNMMIRVNQTII